MGILDAPAIPRESLGTKLRRLADRARTSGHAWSRPYMKTVPPWQPSTAVRQGNVRVNGGSLYVCITAGTTAASGGPTATNSGATINDGTAVWTWFGYNTVTTDPVTSQTAWAASTAYALAAQVTNGGNVYAVVVAGTSAASGGPTGTGNAIVDGTVTWTYLGVVHANPYVHDFPTYAYSTSAPSGLTNVHNFAAQPASAQAAVSVAGGSGYAVNDTITLTGGTFTVAAVLRVTAVNAGAVTAVSVQTAGAYTVLPGTPTAQGSTSGSGTAATFTVRFSQPLAARFRGCYPAGTYSSIHTQVATFQATAGAASIAQHTAIEFWSDTPRLYFRLANGADSRLCVIVDGVRYNHDALDASAAANNYYLLDFTASSGKKWRLWRIEGISLDKFSQIAIDSTSQLVASDDANRVRAVCISDSIFAGSGYGPFVPGNTVTLRLGHELGWNDVWSFTQGGTGYVNRGTNAGVTTDKYGYRIAEALALTPDIWVLMGSTNDIGQSGITAAVTAVIQAIRNGGSTAPIIVLGLWPKNDAGVAATEAAVLAGVTGADPLAKTTFIPTYNDPYLPWVGGSWNNNPAPSGLVNTSHNTSALVISGDATHPPDAGTEYLARRIANAIRANVLPTVA